MKYIPQLKSFVKNRRQCEQSKSECILTGRSHSNHIQSFILKADHIVNNYAVFQLFFLPNYASPDPTTPSTTKTRGRTIKQQQQQRQ